MSNKRKMDKWAWEQAQIEWWTVKRRTYLVEFHPYWWEGGNEFLIEDDGVLSGFWKVKFVLGMKNLKIWSFLRRGKMLWKVMEGVNWCIVLLMGGLNDINEDYDGKNNNESMKWSNCGECMKKDASEIGIKEVLVMVLAQWI